MECKACHAECADGSKFCSACGARLDGKKVCVFCGEEVSEDSNFCPACGARLVAKKEPETEPIKGSVVATECAATCSVAVDKPQKKSGGYAVYQKIAGIIVPSFMLAALLVLFVCSFFMNVSTEYSGEMVSTGSTTSIDLFKEIIRILDNDTGTSLAMTKISVEYKVYCVLFLVVLGANIITCFSMLLVAGVKFGKGLAKNDGNKNVYVYLAIALGTFAVTAVLTKAFCYAYTREYGLYGRVSEQTDVVSSSGIKCGLIFSAVFTLIAFAIKLSANGKTVISKGVLTKNICSCVSLLFIVIVLALLAKSMLVLETNISNSSYVVETGLSAGSIASIAMYDTFKKTVLATFFTKSGIIGVNVGCWAVLGVLVLSAGGAICALTCSLFSDKQNCNGCLKSVIISLALSVVYLILVIIAAGLVVEDYDVSYGNVIAAVVLLAGAFVSTLVCTIINGRKNHNESEIEQ